MRDFIRRIEREAGVPDLAQILADCEPTDLQSLLMEVYGQMAERRNAFALVAEYSSNRFTRPSGCDPARILEWDSIALSHLPRGFQAIELSPVSPLGTISLVAPISQDWVLSTIRNTEVVADPTNVLALECAVRRRELIKKSTGATRDWTQKLLNNAKERLVISGIGTERVCENFIPVTHVPATAPKVRRPSRSRRSG